MHMEVYESILDDPKPSLDPNVWQEQPNDGKPILTPEAVKKLDLVVNWVQKKYKFNNLSVFIIGSICSNSWSENSDIDIDFCAVGATKDDNDEDAVKEFGWAFKKDFIENYMEKFPDDAKIGSHPFEVYFNPNPFQCFMSVGCYNFLEKKWEVGPQTKGVGFDPVSEYYADAMKQVDKILKDIRAKIFELYELAFVVKKSKDLSFQKKQVKEICKKLEEASNLFTTMKKVRSNFQKPAKSKEEALKRREDRKQHVVDAAFKFLEKFGYIQILKDVIAVYDKFQNGEKVEDSQLVDTILQSVKDNMSLKHLQDSEDQAFAQRLQEAKCLDEGIGNLVKVSAIAAMMAIPNLLQAAPLTKELSKAKQVNKALSVNSPETKQAITKAAIDNKMIGQMSEINVVNAVAKVLWKEARGEGEEGIKAVASVILNRTGNDPTYIIDVIKMKKQFSCLNGYIGGWTDKTYKWYNPDVKELKNSSSNATWEFCKKIAQQLVSKQFKSTIGNRNVYANDNLDDQSNLDSWGKKCDLKVRNHRFGYLKEYDPKIVKPGTMTSWKKINSQKNVVIVVVKSGDTLGKIAKDNKTTVEKILALNTSIKNPNRIGIGQKIRVA